MVIKTQTDDFFRTRIVQITRMSPVGSLACVSCLLFNQHSVDSSHSCSIKTQSRVPLINIRLIRVIRVLLKLKCFVFLLNHKCFVFHPQATRTRGPKNQCYQCYPCGTKHKQVMAIYKIYLMIPKEIV